jgi:hypothetical protein
MLVEHRHELGRQIAPHGVVFFLAAFATSRPFAGWLASASDLALEGARLLVLLFRSALQPEALVLRAIFASQAGSSPRGALCVVLARELLPFGALAFAER